MRYGFFYDLAHELLRDVTTHDAVHGMDWKPSAQSPLPANIDDITSTSPKLSSRIA
jgi:hypothetical protein